MAGTPKRLRPLLGEPSRAYQSPGAAELDGAAVVSSALCGCAASEAYGAAVAGASAAAEGVGQRTARTGSRHGPSNGRNERDPRPVGDRRFAAQCAKDVTEFLSSRGYGKMVSAERFLRNPSSKEFYDIFKFLLAQIDSKLELNGPMEQEIPQVMRRLKYPVEVNKSKLQAISGPNTWPQLLAVLAWIIVVIQIQDEYIQPVSACAMGFTELADHTDPAVLQFIQESYQDYLQGNDCEGFEERLRQIFHERVGALEDETQRLKDEQSSTELQLNEFRSEHDRFLELENAPEQLKLEAELHRAATQRQEAQAKRIESEIEAVEQDELRQLQEIDELQSSVRQLNEQVGYQSYSKMDIERLKCERAHLQRMLEDLRLEGEKTEHQVWELTMRDSERTEGIKRLVRQVSACFDCADQQGFTSSPDLSEATDVLSTLDFSDEIQRVQASCNTESKALQSEEVALHEVRAAKCAVQERMSELNRDCSRLKLRVEQLQRIRNDNRMWSSVQLDDALRTAEETEDAVDQALSRNTGPTAMDAAEIDDLRLELQHLREENALLEDIVSGGLEVTTKDRDAVIQELHTYQDAMESLCEKVVVSAQAMGESSLEDHSLNLRQRVRSGGC